MASIPVADSVRVQIVQRIECLSHDKCSLGLSQVFTLCDKEEEFTALAQSKTFQIMKKMESDFSYVCRRQKEKGISL